MAEVYAAISGLELVAEQFDLGQGIIIRRTFGHLMMPSVMAFAPAKEGEPHPAPWRTVQGGSGIDFHAELFIPESIGSNELKMEAQRAVAFLLRLGVNPAITVSALATHSFSKLQSMPDSAGRIRTFETKERSFELRTVGEGKLDQAGATWIAERWEKTRDLVKTSPEFYLAVSALDAGQFERNTALALISLWGALEALFSGDRSELRFRISSYIASYLIPYGQGRDKRQRSIAKLYDKRSAAVHGIPNHRREDVLETFVLMREVLTKMIEDGKAPTREDLERCLFGG